MTVYIMSRHEAENFVPEPATAAISIRCTGDPPAELRPGYYAVLHLEFDDVNPSTGENRSVEANPFTPELADTVAAWAVHQLDQGMEHLVVHCLMGISRSPGLALGLLEGWGESPNDKTFPHANPHVRRLMRAAASNRLESP